MYEIFMDDKSLYYPGDKINVVTEAKIREALDDAGYMDITVPPTNPLYDSIQERKTDIEVYKDNKSIWEGEVRDISDNMKKEKKLYVVGVVSFLNDSIQSPRHINQAPVQALGELLNEHNSQVELKKQFKLGVVTIDVPEIDIDVDYESTLSVIRDKICSKYAGYLRVRKEDGIKYIDVVKIEDYGTTCQQPLEFGSNLLDYAKNITTDSIATSVVPLGKETKNEDGIKSYVTIESVNDGKNYIYDQDAVNSFGWIKRIVKFKDVEDPLVLLEEGEKWLKENQYAQLIMKLKAVDLSLLNADIDSFNLGDNVNAKAKPFGLDAWYYIRDKETDLLHPANNSVTVGNTVLKGYTQKVKEEYKEMEAIIPNSTEFLEAAQQNATNLIKLATTGYIHLVMDENGNPKELLIMDTADIQTAHKIWRWNINGLGYSSTGYDGEYELAMTMDGSIVADRITTGILNASLIRAGKIQDAKGNNYWDMETGEFRLAGTTIVGSSTVASKQDAKNEADRAEENANSATDDKLSSYSTTTESQNYANNAAGKAEENANSATDEKLRDYSTTTESQSYADEAATNAANALNSSLDMEEIFNRLTKDGTVKGIYLIDGQLYVNASYIKSGTLQLGGAQNVNGEMEILDSDSETLGVWNSEGFWTKSTDYSKPETTYAQSAYPGCGSFKKKVEIKIIGAIGADATDVYGDGSYFTSNGETHFELYAPDGYMEDGCPFWTLSGKIMLGHVNMRHLTTHAGYIKRIICTHKTKKRTITLFDADYSTSAPTSGVLVDLKNNLIENSVWKIENDTIYKNQRLKGQVVLLQSSMATSAGLMSVEDLTNFSQLMLVSENNSNGNIASVTTFPTVLFLDVSTDGWINSDNTNYAAIKQYVETIDYEEVVDTEHVYLKTSSTSYTAKLYGIV